MTDIAPPRLSTLATWKGILRLLPAPAWSASHPVLPLRDLLHNRHGAIHKGGGTLAYRGHRARVRLTMWAGHGWVEFSVTLGQLRHVARRKVLADSRADQMFL